MAKWSEPELTRRAFAHLQAIRRYDRGAIMDAIHDQLTATPDQETRNRKRLRDNPLADWELRVGQYRVFYEVDAQRHRVTILAVGRKEGNRLIIEGKEVRL
jgi:mRNA-degrading endonuclease RelE of RelBE toxin-antitoxin system